MILFVLDLIDEVIGLLKSSNIIVIIFCLFVFNRVSSQEFIVLNSSDKKPVSFAHVDFLNGYGTNADTNGKFSTDSRIDSVRISSMGFMSAIVYLPDTSPKNEIFLQENPVELEEVSLLSKKSKILKHKGSTGLGIFIRDFTFDEKVITYVPFPDIKSDNVIIKNIVINTTGFSSKERRYHPFKVNLYKSQAKYSPPKLKDSLITGIITSRKKGNPSKVKINVEDFNIKLSSKGVFVSFETLDKNFYPNDSIYKYTKEFKGQYWHPYTATGVRTIKSNHGKTKSYSYKLIRKKYFEIDGKEINEDYWQLEKKLIYDITIEIKY